MTQNTNNLTLKEAKDFTVFLNEQGYGDWHFAKKSNFSSSGGTIYSNVVYIKSEEKLESFLKSFMGSEFKITREKSEGATFLSIKDTNRNFSAIKKYMNENVYGKYDYYSLRQRISRSINNLPIIR